MLVAGTIVRSSKFTSEHGFDTSKYAINTDPTLGGRFTTIDGWTLQKGRLPGLFGKAVDMPVHLQIPPVITTINLPNDTVGTAYNQTLTASTAPIVWSIIGGNLPTGLLLDSATGVISGVSTTTGTFHFTVKAENSAGEDTLSFSLDIICPNITVIAYSDTLCYGEVYNDAYFNNKTTAGTYYDTLQNMNGCDSVIELTLVFYPSVAVTSYSDTLCYGEIYNDDHFKNKTIAGIYYDTLQNINGCDSVIELTLAFYPLPVISRSGDVLTSTAANSYQWYLDGAAIEGETNQTHTCTQNGDYYVEITDENGCTAQSAVETVTDVGIAQWKIENGELKVYPNPTRGEIRLTNLDFRLTIDDIAIYDVVGQLLQSKIVNLQSEIVLDVSHLAKGMYYLKVNNKVVKVVKE
jgi:hypothetical protein